MKTKSLLVYSLCSTIIVGNTFAAITVTPTPPTTDIYKFQAVAPDRTPATLRFSNNSTSGWQSLGQGFSTLDAESPLVLSSVSFLMIDYLPGVEGMTLRMDVFRGSTSTNARPMGENATLVYTLDSTLPEILSNNSYLNISLDSELILNPDTYYSVALSFIGETPGTTNMGIGLGTIASGTPAILNTIGGNRWVWNGSIYSASTTNGFVMYVEATPIPEAGSQALLAALCAWALVLYRKRLRA